MQCNKTVIKVLKLFLIFQFGTNDYISKTQVSISVFEESQDTRLKHLGPNTTSLPKY